MTFLIALTLTLGACSFVAGLLLWFERVPDETPTPTEDDVAWLRLRAAVDGPHWVAWESQMRESA